MSQKLTFAGTTATQVHKPNDEACVGSLQFVSGTGTLVVEGLIKLGTTYGALPLLKSDGTYAASAASAGIYNFDPGACDNVQVRCSAFTSAIVAYANIVPVNH